SVSSGQVPVVVTDLVLPDLVVKNAIAPEEVETDAYFTVGYRLENRGAASTAVPFTQRILLSTDPVPGDDIVINEFEFGGVLNGGVGFDRTETVRAPQQAGTYWILVVADANN